MNEPLFCPFCGEQNPYIKWREEHGGRYAFVECSLCGARSKGFEYHGSTKCVDITDGGVIDAVESWNRRSSNPQRRFYRIESHLNYLEKNEK